LGSGETRGLNAGAKKKALFPEEQGFFIGLSE
jgi:hypothetical protein